MIIIPARLKSSRFSEKILAPINGVPMFVASAKNAELVDETVVACDDIRVQKIAAEFGIKAIMTANTHESGTERLCEASEILGLKDDEIIINLQADEPLFECENIAKFSEFSAKFKDEFFMSSCFARKSAPSDANTVKVVLDKDDFALYFSRASIPYDRDEKGCEYLHHIGIYAYTKAALKEFVNLASSLEKIEKLEQLRALENGKKIKMCEIKTQSFGIDTKEDYERLIAYLNKR